MTLERNDGRTPAVPLVPALLEHWMRQYYFATDHDIGSSGVEDFSLAELRSLVPGLAAEDLDTIVFHDSQTLGGAGLRRAVAERFAGGDVDRTMATHGSSEANFLLMNALLAPGDEVVALDPCYPQLFLIAQGIGCRLSRWQLRFEDAYRADLGALRRLVTPRTRMIIVNFPHNPTGTTLSADEQRELVEIAAEAGAYLVWDNAFGELVYDEPPLPDPGLFYGRAVSMGTLSKGYGLPGLRVGWCLAAPEVLERLVHLRDYVTLHLSPLVELVAQRAIESADVLVGLRLAQARRNRDRLAAWVEAQEGISWVRPRGGVSAFPRLDAVSDVEAFCHQLARQRRVLLVPGICFEHSQHVRLGFGGSEENLAAGLAALSEQLSTVEATTASAFESFSIQR